MPTRRILELMVLVSLAIVPIAGMGRLWSAKTLAATNSGSISHGAAEIGSVIF